MKYTEEDIVKHWGVWFKEPGAWLTDGDGIIFAVTCPRVAEVQLSICVDSWGADAETLEIREIKP